MESTKLQNMFVFSFYTLANKRQPQFLGSVWLLNNLQTLRMITLDKAGRSRVVTIIKMSNGTRQKSAKPYIGKRKIRILFVYKHLLCWKSTLWLDIKSQELQCHAAALIQWLEIERTNRCLNKSDILNRFYYIGWNALNSRKLLRKSSIPNPLKKCVRRKKNSNDLDRYKTACSSLPTFPLPSADKRFSESRMFLKFIR